MIGIRRTETSAFLPEPAAQIIRVQRLVDGLEDPRCGAEARDAADLSKTLGCGGTTYPGCRTIQWRTASSARSWSVGAVAVPSSAIGPASIQAATTCQCGLISASSSGSGGECFE